MLDRTAKLKTYQTYIDGRWIDAASGKTFETYDPYTGQSWALIPECDKVDVDQAVDAASRAFESGPWPKMTPSARGKIMRRIARLIEQHAEHLGQMDSTGQRKAHLRNAGTDQIHAGMVLLLWRPRRQNPRYRGCGRSPESLQLHSPGAGRRLRLHHTVEFAADADNLETRACVGRRVHRSHQTIRIHVPHPCSSS